MQVIEQPANQANQIPGVRVADKTGTADFPTDLGYTSGKTFASIVALIPADQPEPRNLDPAGRSRSDLRGRVAVAGPEAGRHRACRVL